jgi:hypothetical protein
MRTYNNIEVKAETLPPHYVSGLVDGEGCFALNFWRDKKHGREGKPEYFYWTIKFIIVLRNDDEELLQKVRNTLDCGYVRVYKHQARYSVDRMEDLKGKVVPFFSKYRLYGKKRRDFLLWAMALDILYRNRRPTMHKGKQGFARIQWKPTDIQRLLELSKEMEPYKSKRPAWKWLSVLGEGDHDH